MGLWAGRGRGEGSGIHGMRAWFRAQFALVECCGHGSGHAHGIVGAGEGTGRDEGGAQALEGH